MKKVKYILNSCIVLIIIAFGTVSGVCIYYSSVLAESYYIYEGENLDLKGIPVKASFVDKEMAVSGSSERKMELKLLGLFKVKNINVTSVKQQNIAPSGRPFGIKLLTKGIVTIGLGDVSTENGNISPAKDAGLREGDILISINGEQIKSTADFSGIIQECGENGSNVEVIYQRNGKENKASIKPVVSKIDGKARAGIWVRDSSAGLGTMTFVNTETKVFGGLGHPVCDIDTGIILPIDKAYSVPVIINSVTKGVKGNPGALNGSFISAESMGSVTVNNESGVFGILDEVDGRSYKELPVCLKQDVEVGEAKILTTIEGTEPKEYDILIEKINYDYEQMSKNMIIKITDKELLQKTGGVVQGMSGSPIIQNGKFIGAITHVFVNDPERGYGIFAENMVKFTQTITDNEKAQESLNEVA